ncbi:MAG: preprotein translocase subunit SecG [Myxococcota bacterium]
MSVFVAIVHVLLCLLLVTIVLLQHGKGADMGVALGGGGSQTVFGARGAGNFLTRLTAGTAILFMVTSLVLSYSSRTPTASELLQEALPAESPAAPAPLAEPSILEEEAEPAPEPMADQESDVPSGFEEIPTPTEAAPEPSPAGGTP